MIIFAICMPPGGHSPAGNHFRQPARLSGSRLYISGTVLRGGFCHSGLRWRCHGASSGDFGIQAKKILKRYQVTPASPAPPSGGPDSGIYRPLLASLVLVYAAAVLFSGARFPGSAAAYLAVFLFVMLAIFSIGMMIGGIAPDVRTAGMWASILYFPMLVLSGATLPHETMPSGLQRGLRI